MDWGGLTGLDFITPLHLLEMVVIKPTALQSVALKIDSSIFTFAVPVYHVELRNSIQLWQGREFRLGSCNGEVCLNVQG